MKTIREEASDILGTRIEEGHWDESFGNLDRVGKLTMRIMFELVLLILKKLDEKEKSL